MSTFGGLPCPVCGEYCWSWGGLLLHVERHTAKPCVVDHGYECPCCTLRWGGSQGLMNHFEELAADGQLEQHIIHAATIHALLGDEA